MCSGVTRIFPSGGLAFKGGGGAQIFLCQFGSFKHDFNYSTRNSKQKRMYEYSLTQNMGLKGKFSSGIEGALASTLDHDFNWKQLSEMMLCIVLLMFSKFI